MTVGSNKVNMIAGQYQCIGFESITVTTAAKGLTEAEFTDEDDHVAKKAVITIESAQVRYRYDGTSPTASVGHLLNPFDVITLIGSTNIRNFSIIRAGDSNATIRVSYEL